MSEKNVITTTENIELEDIELETCDFATYFRGRNGKYFLYEWVTRIWHSPIPKGLSKTDPGELKRTLRSDFGLSAVGSNIPYENFRLPDKMCCIR